MGQVIHRKGTRYRVWSTVSDQYITKSMSRTEMIRHLTREAIWALEEQIRQAESGVRERMKRTDEKGTSSHVGGNRDITQWDTERCDGCGNFHHTFKQGLTRGGCSHCGESEDDKAHKPPCKKEQ